MYRRRVSAKQDWRRGWVLSLFMLKVRLRGSVGLLVRLAVTSDVARERRERSRSRCVNSQKVAGLEFDFKLRGLVGLLAQWFSTSRRGDLTPRESPGPSWRSHRR